MRNSEINYEKFIRLMDKGDIHEVIKFVRRRGLGNFLRYNGKSYSFVITFSYYSLLSWYRGDENGKQEFLNTGL